VTGTPPSQPMFKPSPQKKLNLPFWILPPLSVAAAFSVHEGVYVPVVSDATSTSLANSTPTTQAPFGADVGDPLLRVEFE
jgi:hypothetical protein